MNLLETDKRLSFFRSTLHPLISIFIPYFFIVSLSCILNIVFKHTLNISPWLFLLLLLIGVEESVVGNILYKENIGIIHRIRECLLFVIIIYVFLFSIQQGGFKQRMEALKTWNNFYPLIAVLFQWFLSLSIHNKLREREKLLEVVHNKAGDNLKGALRKNTVIVGSSILGIQKINKLIIIFQILIFAFLLIFFGMGIKPGAALVFLVTMHAVSGLFFIIILNNAIEDQILLIEGISVSSMFQRRRVYYGLILLLVIFCFVFIFAKETSILSLSIFQALYKWIAGLLGSVNLYNGESGIKFPEGLSNPELLDTLKELKKNEPGLLADFVMVFLKILSYIILSIVGGIILYFFLYPIFSKYFRIKLKMLHPVEVLWNKITCFILFIKSILSDFIIWIKTPNSSLLDTRKVKKGKKKRKKYKENSAPLFKKIEIGKVLKYFYKLIRWGEKRGIPYKNHIAPMEYGFILSEKVKAQTSRLKDAMDILEEVLFSKSLVNEERLKRYFYLIKSIVQLR